MDVDKLQILMTADTLGGVWTYCMSLARALEPFGVHIHLASMGAMPDANQKTQAAQIANLTLHCSNWQLEWMDNPWEEVEAAGHWLKYLQSEIQPDLIHLNNFAHGTLPWKAPVLMVGHSCVLSWWEAVKEEAAPQQYSTYSEEVKNGLQAADAVVAPTAAFLQELKKHYGPFKQEQVIYNGMAPESMSPGSKEPFIFSMGRLWDEAKNIQFCDALAAEGLDWPVSVAGDNQHPNGRQTGFSHINSLGKLPHQEVGQHLAAAGIYLLPAKYEPFGLSVLEAAFAGCTLVLGDIPTLRELWQDAALFISTTDVKAAKAQLQQLLHNKAERQRLVQKATEKAQHYTLSRQGQAYYALYQQLLKQPEKIPVTPKSTTKKIYQP